MSSEDNQKRPCGGLDHSVLQGLAHTGLGMESRWGRDGEHKAPSSWGSAHPLELTHCPGSNRIEDPR